MSAAKHTPGPWIASPCRDILAPCRFSDTDNGMVAGLCSDRPVDEVDANARLIAAAPDMLAALEAIEGKDSYIDATINSHGKTRPVVCGPLARIARAAITKARGA